MDFLLDTHCLIWLITNDPSIPPSLATQIFKGDRRSYISIASLWELNIKYSLGKLELKETPDEILRIIEASNINILHIETSHILEVGKLPFCHRDPFDRMIIAQARVENLIIASRDKVFTEYEVNCIWGN